jgi:hypothetical protein
VRAGSPAQRHPAPGATAADRNRAGRCLPIWPAPPAAAPAPSSTLARLAGAAAARGPICQQPPLLPELGSWVRARWLAARCFRHRRHLSSLQPAALALGFASCAGAAPGALLPRGHAPCCSWGCSSSSSSSSRSTTGGGPYGSGRQMISAGCRYTCAPPGQQPQRRRRRSRWRRRAARQALAECGGGAGTAAAAAAAHPARGRRRTICRCRPSELGCSWSAARSSKKSSGTSSSYLRGRAPKAVGRRRAPQVRSVAQAGRSPVTEGWLQALPTPTCQKWRWRPAGGWPARTLASAGAPSAGCAARPPPPSPPHCSRRVEAVCPARPRRARAAPGAGRRGG